MLNLSISVQTCDWFYPIYNWTDFLHIRKKKKICSKYNITCLILNFEMKTDALFDNLKFYGIQNKLFQEIKSMQSIKSIEV